MNGMKVLSKLDYKGGKRELLDIMPAISKAENYLNQYIKVWHTMFDIVKALNAKTVLEFGTCDGYSARLFSEAMPDGQVYTVDINEIKPFEEKNIHVIHSSVEDLTWTMPVDILYIDDWHNGYHLYYELNKFAKLAKVVIIHDVMLDDELMKAVATWCKQNWVIYTVYTTNACGIAVLEIEKSAALLQPAFKDEPTGKEGGAEPCEPSKQ